MITEKQRAVLALTPAQHKAILKEWLEGKGTEYQRLLAVLGEWYRENK